MSSGAGIYLGQNGNQAPPQEIPSELSLVAELTRATAPMMVSGPPQAHGLPTSHHEQQVHTPVQQHDTPPEDLAHSVMALQQEQAYGQPDDYSDPNSSSARKRSKVSRACDECRRKKIRCDATSENGPEACTSCKRTGAVCQFSRQPMKRGPSKGYIKELAERVARIEAIERQQQAQAGFDHGQQADLQFMHGLSEQSLSGLAGYSPLPAPFMSSRKRSFSTAEDLRDLTGFTRQESTHFLPPQDPPQRQIHYDDTTLGAVEWDESMVDDPFSNFPADHDLMPRIINASLSLERCKYDDSGRWSTSTYVLYVQACVLLALASNNLGPAATRGASMDMQMNCLSKAVAMMYKGGFNAVENRDTLFGTNVDPERQLARRVFWVVYILQRLYAISTSSPVTVANNTVLLMAEDRKILGDELYLTASLLSVAEPISVLLTRSKSAWTETTDVLSSLNPDSSLIVQNAAGQLDRIREISALVNIEASSRTLMNMIHRHLRLMFTRLRSGATPQSCLNQTLRIISLMRESPLASPLYDHHIAALSALTLGELLNQPDTKDGAQRGLTDLDDFLNHRSSGRFPGWDGVVHEYIIKKKASTLGITSPSMNSSTMLQQLADVAAGREGVGERPTSSGLGLGEAFDGKSVDANDSDERVATAARQAAAAVAMMGSAPWDASAALKAGYLNVVAGEV
ncbi:Glucose-responsive transcription factor [Coniosporium apollinis]|uniref:Glucose-responsive transcription factor n=1 Tax=Coniosporium apollinis TaxID=61459 RepID=A0ABQ9P185_9PEZI|nr:Glucose-responsive transcription factor [Coniosporium apollinis]